ncbi:hypothetical protein BGZ68_000944 [Mortierella alpina]|nr:hypothetical protein BGZ68_000944 [Mortierella alpina]
MFASRCFQGAGGRVRLCLLLLFVILAVLNSTRLVAAQSSDDADDDVDGDFSESNDYDYDSDGDSSEMPIPRISPVPPTTTTLPSPQGTAPPSTLPAAPFSGILKPGTASTECSVIADLYRATGPWQFVPDTANCCNAEYPNYSSIKCNGHGQIIYIYLAGSLPDSAPGWTKLGTLNLEQNALTGPLPSWLTTLPSLHSLALGQNFFETGDPRPALTFNLEPGMKSVLPESVTPTNVVVPSSSFLDAFTRLPRLKQLKLDSLGISGTFPASWQQQMVNLTKLDLSNNSMQGLIPAYLDQFSGMKTLLLDHNEFGGPIPSLASLRLLSALDLSYNQLSGALPPWCAGLNLTVLNLSNNLLSGPLPLDRHHAWRACSVANNYFVCTQGPEQVLSNKWKTDCRATCSNTQPDVPLVRPPVSTTLPGIRVYQSHNKASRRVDLSLPVILAGWVSLVTATILFLTPGI